MTTDDTCGEEPHSDRAGKGLTFGVSHRADSPEACCDKCKASKRGCNSWTFCGYPVCFGLDTGWNHTYGGKRTGSITQSQPAPLLCTQRPCSARRIEHPLESIGPHCTVRLTSGLTLAECWLRKLEDATKPTFGQRGMYTTR